MLEKQQGGQRGRNKVRGKMVKRSERRLAGVGEPQLRTQNIQSFVGNFRFYS